MSAEDERHAEVAELRAIAEQDDWNEAEESYNPETYDFPSTEYIDKHWWTITQASQLHGVNMDTLRSAAQDGRVIAKKVGSVRRGQWYFKPAAVLRYIPRKYGD